jgi:opacity protein-like surface antigen
MSHRLIGWIASVAMAALAHGAVAADNADLRGTQQDAARYAMPPLTLPWSARATPSVDPMLAAAVPVDPASPAPAVVPAGATGVPVAAATPWLWTGFYVGGRVGGAVGRATVADPFGSSIFGDNVTPPGFLAGGELGYNWQIPNGPWVFGFEANLDWLDTDGTNTCLAFSGFFVSANCRARPNFAGDVTARLGFAYGAAGHSLLYAKSGAAFVHTHVDVTTNATANFIGVPPQTTGTSFTAPGWIAGVGVEHAISPAWSIKVEYDYLGFAGETVGTPRGLIQPFPPFNGFNFTPATTTRVTQNLQQVSLGLNYRLGMDPTSPWAAAPMALPVKSPTVLAAPGWEFEGGARYWNSRGKFQKDLGDTFNPALPNILISRLTYDTMAGTSEFFGRVDTPLNLFVKGNIGGGSLFDGHLNDEDWAIFVFGVVPYSNTLSQPVKGNIAYATIDVGYDLLRGPGYKLSPFVGYNTYRENKTAFGCTQLANPFSDCAGPLFTIGNTIPVITENDTWKSVRVGLNGEIMIADRLKLGADVAYLPFVAFTGTDNHVLRGLTIQESGSGRGLQLESIISYMITDQLSAGIGGRYWAMWATKSAIADFSGLPCPCQTEPAKTNRFGVFVQASYKFSSASYQ